MGKQWKQWQTLFFGAPKSLQMVTADMKWKMLPPWKKTYDQPRQFIKKQRHYLANKDLSSQTMVFPVVMYGCECWTIKKAEHWRIDAFDLWCWRRLLRVSWTSGRSIQSILKEISPDCSLEGMNVLRSSTAAKNWLFGNDPDAGKDWKQEEKWMTEE